MISVTTVTLMHWWSSRHPSPSFEPEGSKHAETWTTAVVEFHKAQCFFAASIQTAAMVFAKDVINATNDFTSAGLLFTIATSSSIPVIFTLAAIQQHGQKSWYLIILSLCCLVLSLATLGISSVLFPVNSPEGFKLYWSVRTDLTFQTCGAHSVGDLYQAWCGPEAVIPEGMRFEIITSGWNWVLWVNCAIWFLYCFTEKAITTDSTTRSRLARWLQRMVTKISFWRTKKPLLNRIYRTLFLISWTFSFGYHLYLYSLYFQLHQITTSWTFGQIVAITVWAPCIAELLHLERCKCAILLSCNGSRG